jgi:hypothetical protein
MALTGQAFNPIGSQIISSRPCAAPPALSAPPHRRVPPDWPAATSDAAWEQASPILAIGLLAQVWPARWPGQAEAISH